MTLGKRPVGGASPREEKTRYQNMFWMGILTPPECYYCISFKEVQNEEI